jgi:hypothetical protein
MAHILHAVIKTPNEVNSNDLESFDLIGFGSGIDSGRHDLSLLKLAVGLPQK